MTTGEVDRIDLGEQSCEGTTAAMVNIEQELINGVTTTKFNSEEKERLYTKA